MGIGFDFFKATLGARIADAVVDSFSDSGDGASSEVERISTDAEDGQNERCPINRNDMLRTLVFLMGNNRNLERSDKKTIAQCLSGMYGEDISLFSIEDKIDEAYKAANSQTAKEYFADMNEIDYDREQAVLSYTTVLLLFAGVTEEDSVSSAYAYNLALIKRALKMERKELAVCYKFAGEELEMDTDDAADKFEEVTSDEAIKKIEEENPSFVRVEVKKELPPPSEPASSPVLDQSPVPEQDPAPVVCENPRGEITKLYYEAMAEAGKNNVDFSKHVFLADDKPDYVLKAVKSYAKGCVGEDVILLFDNTFTKNCKNGLLLTTKNIYIGYSGILLAKIPLPDVNFIDVKVATFSNVVIINKIEMQSEQVLNDGTKALARLLQKIIPLAMQIEEESKKEGE
ncbi:MAG: hypothetical protein J6P28_05125 [Treponema sp.]|nr:hypothetical protein [Treponema sp.]